MKKARASALFAVLLLTLTAVPGCKRRDRLPEESLILRGPEVEGGQLISSEDRPDGSCRYEEMTDGFVVVCQAVAGEKGGETEEVYAARVVEALSDGGFGIALKDVSGSIDSLGYPCYRANWLLGDSKEDLILMTGLVVPAEKFVYLYYFRTPLDFYEETEQAIEEYLAGAALVRREAPSA